MQDIFLKIIFKKVLTLIEVLVQFYLTRTKGRKTRRKTQVVRVAFLIFEIHKAN